jgi:hypothetical protein
MAHGLIILRLVRLLLGRLGKETFCTEAYDWNYCGYEHGVIGFSGITPFLKRFLLGVWWFCHERPEGLLLTLLA